MIFLGCAIFGICYLGCVTLGYAFLGCVILVYAIWDVLFWGVLFLEYRVVLLALALFAGIGPIILPYAGVP